MCNKVELQIENVEQINLILIIERTKCNFKTVALDWKTETE